MSEDRVNPYEGLFLFPQSATADLQAVIDHMMEILARADAELISLRRFDERRLAYEIKGHKRGVYFLIYFRARSNALVGIERDCNLSEQLLRWLIIRADQYSPEKMEAADGRTELEDEIRLRRDEAVAAASKAEGAKEKAAEKKMDDATIEVNVKPTTEDATTNLKV
ncbi:MAG: 30S ribosomal protein S6 [Planctomycetes bacterium]|nr:30S ribosomal protein S6 [Planctomycetota bacterium]